MGCMDEMSTFPPFGLESKHVWESLKLCGSHLYDIGLKLQDVVLEYMEMDKGRGSFSESYSMSSSTCG